MVLGKLTLGLLTLQRLCPSRTPHSSSINPTRFGLNQSKLGPNPSSHLSLAQCAFISGLWSDGSTVPAVGQENSKESPRDPTTYSWASLY